MSFSSFCRSLPSILATGGVPHSLNDQFRRKFSLDRPYEGGFEAPLGNSMVIYCHVALSRQHWKGADVFHFRCAFFAKSHRFEYFVFFIFNFNFIFLFLRVLTSLFLFFKPFIHLTLNKYKVFAARVFR